MRPKPSISTRFASVAGYKSDAEINLLGLIADAPNFTLLTGKKVVGLLHSDSTPHRVTGVVRADGSSYDAGTVVLAAGALTSPRILQDHIAATGLGHLPSASWSGPTSRSTPTPRCLRSRLQPSRRLRKTAILFNDEFPHSTVQCLGWMDGAILGTATARRRATVRQQRDWLSHHRLLRHHRGRFEPGEPRGPRRRAKRMPTLDLRPPECWRRPMMST